MKIKRLKRPFVLLLAFVLLLSSISQSVSAADTGQVINYPSLPIFKGKSFNAFGKTHHSMNYYQVVWLMALSLHSALKKAKNYQTIQS